MVKEPESKDSGSFLFWLTICLLGRYLGMSKSTQILDVAMALLSEKEKYTAQGQKPYVTAREVYENVSNDEITYSDVQEALLDGMEYNLKVTEVGSEIFTVAQYTV